MKLHTRVGATKPRIINITFVIFGHENLCWQSVSQQPGTTNHPLECMEIKFYASMVNKYFNIIYFGICKYVNFLEMYVYMYVCIYVYSVCNCVFR